MPKTYDQPCPVAKALEILGDRWTLLIIRDLLLGKTRFQELQESLPGIATNVLSDRLKNLEASEIVETKLYNDHPPRYSYHLTRKGKDLGVIVGALYAWGQRHTDTGSSLIDQSCGHQVELCYYCRTCNSKANAATCAPCACPRQTEVLTMEQFTAVLE